MVVDWGWVMSTKPEVVKKVPTPLILTVTPVPDVSVTFHDSRTVWLPPTVTLLGFAEKELIVGGGHDVAVIVTWAVANASQAFWTNSV